MYLVSASQMQRMDRKTIEDFGIPGFVLMENAGRGAVRFFLSTFENLGKMKIGVVCGKGNNGGDGFVMARYLACRNMQVAVYLLCKPKHHFVNRFFVNHDSDFIRLSHTQSPKPSLCPY